MEDLDLVAKPGAGIFAVGNAVAQHLTRRQFPRPITRVIHYSGQAGRACAAAIAEHKDDFEKFRNSVFPKLLLATAKDVLSGQGSSPRAWREACYAGAVGRWPRNLRAEDEGRYEFVKVTGTENIGQPTVRLR